MSPGRLSETSILASADSGCQTASRSTRWRHSSGHPETSAIRNVPAVDITLSGTAEILDHVNRAAMLVRLDEQDHFIVRIDLIVIQVLNRPVELQPQASSVEPCFR